jgi:hypothetical protein
MMMSIFDIDFDSIKIFFAPPMFVLATIQEILKWGTVFFLFFFLIYKQECDRFVYISCKHSVENKTNYLKST